MDVTDEMVEAGARAAAIHNDYDGCFERLDAWAALEQWERDAYPDEEPTSDAEDAQWWRDRVRSALLAALADDHLVPRIPTVEFEYVLVPDSEGTDLSPITYLGWGGVTRSVVTDLHLGRGVRRTPLYGVRRAVWDAAFGYVSGFRKRDIVYYLLTRSLSVRVSDWVIEWERRTGRDRRSS